MAIALQIKVNEKLSLRDPEQTELGRNILMYGLQLIDELGYEGFTFKKLANTIGSTEASVYRYFENKHKLLLYLVSWYWNWVHYRIEFHTHNLEDPEERLRTALRVLLGHAMVDRELVHLDAEALHRLVLMEGPKTYLLHQVDQLAAEGLFQGYEALVKQLASLVSGVNPNYPQPCALAVTLLEAANQQLFFAAHLPALTELRARAKEDSEVTTFLEELAMRTLRGT